MKKIFILASERSGTNMLRKLLGSHSQLSGPLPLHAWHHLSNLLPYYGPLDVPENYDKIIGDALYLANIDDAILSWNKNLRREDLTPFLTERSLSSTAAALYSTYARMENTRGWICKEINLFEHAYQILSTFPDAKFIYLTRDGRDVAASVKKMLSQSRVTYYIAKKWKVEQAKCLSIYNNLKNKNNIHLVKYEDLITNPVCQLTEICNFIQVPFENEMLNFHMMSSSKEESNIHNLNNISKPLNQNNFNKYPKELSVEEIKTFENICGEVLLLLGYKLDYPKKQIPISKTKKIKFYLQNYYYRRRDQSAWNKKNGVIQRKAALAQLYKLRENET